VFEFTLEHVGQDLHVAVGVRAEALARLHGIVVEDAQRAPVEILRVVIVGKAERVVRLQPTVIEGGALAGALNGEGGRGLNRHGASYNRRGVAERFTRRRSRPTCPSQHRNNG
jgi:hypothetical protein